MGHRARPQGIEDSITALSALIWLYEGCALPAVRWGQNRPNGRQRMPSCRGYQVFGRPRFRPLRFKSHHSLSSNTALLMWAGIMASSLLHLEALLLAW